jgi:hypothetical protein
MNDSAIEPNNPIFKILHEIDNRCSTERTNNKEKASRQTHTQETTTKVTKKNSTGKTQVKNIYNSTKNSINNNK